MNRRAAPGVAWLLLGLVASPAMSASPARAAERVQISPDRPSVSNNTDTVPPATFQIESGVAFARERSGGRPTERRLSVEATLRAGLTERLEARLEGEPFVRLRGEEDATDHGDVILALKYRFLDAAGERWWRPAVSVVPSVTLPIADAPIGSERPDFTAIGIASFALPGDISLDVNAGVSAVGQRRPSGYLLQALVSVSVAPKVTERLSVFGEVAFSSRDEREGRHAVSAGAGLVYLLSDRVAVDAAAAVSLAGTAPDYLVRAGLSVLLAR